MAAGVRIEGNSFADLTGASVCNNGGDGVSVASGSIAILDNAKITGNRGDGVVVSDSQVSLLNALIANNGPQVVYENLGIDPKAVPKKQLDTLLALAIECKSQGQEETVIHRILSAAAAGAGLLAIEPMTAALAIVAASGIEVLRKYREAIRAEEE
ncbi:hypothetical protein HaloA020_29480 [Halomonas sp. A020]|uniref:right-handed parallel beta-helix repeat-containing protein n=1 Tax=Halomonas sp. A020 TaxID=2717374 RepID=UPI002490BC24|nr:right-handed parallel beta-helix repeat-containing protein [Halomonas sp. A020]BCB62247.1 hypothetical protein HaloA020_29480 [Halomonas sp. A020]